MMNNGKPIKSIIYEEPANGSRSVRRPDLGFKNTCKSVIKCGTVLDKWSSIVKGRPKRRKLAVHVTYYYALAYYIVIIYRKKYSWRIKS